MSETIKPKLAPLFQQKIPFYKTNLFKVVLIISFMIIISLAVFFIIGTDYSAQTLEKTI